MLKMKKECEKCGTATDKESIAYICSFECTFCYDCTNLMSSICPNCNGELLLRPKRLRSPIEVASSQLINKLFGKAR